MSAQGDIGKLPVWAQRHIRDLQNQITTLTEQVEGRDESVSRGARVFLVTFDRAKAERILTPIGGDHTTVLFTGDHGNIEVSARWNGRGPDSGVARTVEAGPGTDTHFIGVWPHVSNVVELTAGDDTNPWRRLS